MTKDSEFDTHARTYNEVLNRSIAFSGEDSAYFSEYKIRDLHYELTRAGVNAASQLKLLDFGCGIGGSMPYARKYFVRAELLGLDVSEDCLNEARARYGALAKFLSLGEGKWPVEVHNLDAAFAMCVFHHINEGAHVQILAEIQGRLKPGGMMMVYEHNPYNPLTVKLVNNCPFDKNARLIRASLLAKRCRDAGYKDVRVEYRVFFPGFLRVFRYAERQLSRLPLGGQYYVRCFA